MVATAALAVPIALCWVVLLSTLSDLAGSDAAGNGLARAYAAIEIVILWSMLAILTFIAMTSRPLPGPAVVAALLLVPGSAVAAFATLELLSHPSLPPFLWPIAVPALTPPLIVAFASWAVVPGLRAVRAPIAAAVAWGGTLVLCLAILPLMQVRQKALAQEEAARQRYDRDFAALPADAPLWDLAPFLATPDETKIDNVLARVRRLDRRQADAELMLERGDFPLGYLGRFELAATLPLCDKARALLRRRAAALVPAKADAKPYGDIASTVADAVAAIEWLTAQGCPCAPEALAWQDTAKAYRDPNYDVYRLGELGGRKP
jgi:hypothetical protein